MIFLAIFTPMIGSVALSFQSFEFVWFAIFGIIICGNLTAPKDPLKGWISGFIGLFVAMIGMEGIHAYIRFSFGNSDLSGGISLIPAMVGTFGFAEILSVMRYSKVEVVKSEIGRILPKPREVAKYWKTIIRSGVVGTFIGAIPGVGGRISPRGCPMIWPSAAPPPRKEQNSDMDRWKACWLPKPAINACVPGAIIPVLTLAIPGSAPAAVLLGAMLIHGVRPGPLIMIESPMFVYQVIAMVLIATVAMFVLGLTMVRPLVKVLQVPRQKLMPIVFLLCVVGSFALQSRLFDVYVMIIFGIIGFVLREMEYPMAPLVLGIILGDILDKNLRRALILSNGDIAPFFTRPICLGLFILTMLIVLSRAKWIKTLMGKLKRGKATV